MNYLSKENSIFIKRNKRRTLIKTALIALAVAVALVVLVLVNYRYSNFYRGGTDFLVNWVSARVVVLEGGSPYTDAAADRILQVRRDYTDPPYTEDLRMVYPIYTTLLFLPFSLITDYTLALALWSTILQVSLVLLAFLSIKLVDWRPTPLLFAVFFGYAVLGFHSVQAVYKGDVIILLTLLMVLGLLVLKNGQEELSGVILAFLTIKPQVVVLPILFLFIWLIRQSRWRTIFWFFAISGIFIALGFVVLPDWPIQYIQEILKFKSVHPVGNIVETFSAVVPSFGERLGWLITAIISFIMVVEWFLSNDKSFNRLIWVFSFSLAVNQWVNIYNDAGNFVILLPALALVLSTFQKRWKRSGALITIVMLLILFFGIWLIPSWGTLPSVLTQPKIALYLVLPGFLLVTLYWIRWWLATPDIWLEQFTPFK